MFAGIWAKLPTDHQQVRHNHRDGSEKCLFHSAGSVGSAFLDVQASWHVLTNVYIYIYTHVYIYIICRCVFIYTHLFMYQSQILATYCRLMNHWFNPVRNERCLQVVGQLRSSSIARVHGDKITSLHSGHLVENHGKTMEKPWKTTENPKILEQQLQENWLNCMKN